MARAFTCSRLVQSAEDLLRSSLSWRKRNCASKIEQKNWSDRTESSNKNSNYSRPSLRKPSMPKSFSTTCSTRASSRRTSKANGKCRVMPTEPTSSRLTWRNRSNSSSKSDWTSADFFLFLRWRRTYSKIDLIYLFSNLTLPFNSPKTGFQKQDFGGLDTKILIYELIYHIHLIVIFSVF